MSGYFFLLCCYFINIKNAIVIENPIVWYDLPLSLTLFFFSVVPVTQMYPRRITNKLVFDLIFLHSVEKSLGIIFESNQIPDQFESWIRPYISSWTWSASRSSIPKKKFYYYEYGMQLLHELQNTEINMRGQLRLMSKEPLNTID